jgi:methionine-rich copper-binding protein CopC
MQRWKWMLPLAILVLMMAPTVTAHTRLERSVPAADSTVVVSPPRLVLWFSERLEPAFSEVQVLSAEGTQLDKGDAQVDADDGRQIGVSLPELAPGSYRVHWRVLSVDTHVNEGDFTFDVRP